MAWEGDCKCITVTASGVPTSSEGCSRCASSMHSRVWKALLSMLMPEMEQIDFTLRRSRRYLDAARVRRAGEGRRGLERAGEGWGWRRHRVSTLATRELRSEPPHSIILVMAVCVLGGCCFQIRSAGWKIKIKIRSGSRKNKKPIYGLNKPSTNSPWRGTRTVCFLFVFFFQSFSIWSMVEVL